VRGQQPPGTVKQAVLIVLDSVGVGHAPDAGAFGDEGADTLGHIREAVPGLSLPSLDEAGLAAAAALAAGRKAGGSPTLSWGCLSERSAGKDTVTGHWELAGAILEEPFATFERFPDELVAEMERLCGTGFLGNYARSGTVILEELGAEHLRTGLPILYTSADSVIQVAAHESVLPAPRLHELCLRLRPLADRERIGRVIARPFEGAPGDFRRTANRHDFAMRPPLTVLDRLGEIGVGTVGVGKIGDIFSGAGIARSLPTKGNAEGCETIDRLLAEPPGRPRLVFANLVDFDSLYGHRRDPQGYARALAEFDAWFGGLLPRLDDETLLLVTADHGNDPTWTGTDHTRERVPLLVKGPFPPRCIGVRETFGDVAATLALWFGASFEGLAGEALALV
jgi:phosphopentomutase